MFARSWDLNVTKFRFVIVRTNVVVVVVVVIQVLQVVIVGSRNSYCCCCNLSSYLVSVSKYSSKDKVSS